MQGKKYFLWLLTLVALMLQFELSAQTTTKNTFSPYSMYGVGELQSAGTLATRSMGSAGVAMRSIGAINLLNPASYSIALRRGVLLDFGAQGGSYFSAQNIGGSTQKGTYTTANFNNISLQMPIAKGLGFGFSVSPYSSVGYRNLSNSIEPDLGYIATEKYGTGTISEVKFGVGWEIMSGLSVGFAAQYYWGDIDRGFYSEITNMTSTGNAISVNAVDNITVSRVKGQFGLQAELANNDKRVITMGATLDLGGDLRARSVRAAAGLESSSDTYVYAQGDTTTMSIVLPRQATLGVEYSTQKLLIEADLNYQAWANRNSGTIGVMTSGMTVSYNNFGTARLGVQYTPNRADVRHYHKRVSYRLGGRFGGYQYSYSGEELTQYAVTMGAGFPIKVIGISKIDAGLEWGGLGSLKSVMVNGTAVNMVRQNYLKFALGFTLFGDDYWFIRPQID
ncbi:MAG: hypothetical protein SNG14_02040 [Rikenellaceae bacterium]